MPVCNNAPRPWRRPRNRYLTDPRLQELEAYLASTQKPLEEDPKLTALKRAVDLSTKQLTNKRLYGAQDIAWALINNPAFLFNH